jgi:hypothetical protein
MALRSIARVRCREQYPIAAKTYVRDRTIAPSEFNVVLLWLALNVPDRTKMVADIVELFHEDDHTYIF